MPKNAKSLKRPLFTTNQLYWIFGFAVVCYLLHDSVEIRRLSNFVETDPNDVYSVLKDPVNLLMLHPNAVEIRVLDRRSEMTLEFADFYMTEQLAYGNSTTLVHLIASPVERKVTLQVNVFVKIIKINISWNIYAVNKGSKTYTQIEEEISVTSPMVLRYIIGEMLHNTHYVMLERIREKYSSQTDINLL